jgi:hypothetical protein
MSEPSTPQRSIRDGVVWNQDFGYLLVCNPQTEETTPYTWIRVWHQGQLSESWVEFNADSVCRTVSPGRGIVLTSAEGLYSVFSSQVHAGSIFDESQPQPTQPRYGSIRAVAEIDGRAHAVGLRGMVYRLDTPALWTRIDEQLSREFDGQAIHGFSGSDLYAAGFRGELWHFDGRDWQRRDLPTNVNLTSVKCAADGVVYIGGHGGLLIRGRNETWEIIDHGETESDIWDLDWFAGELYVSTLSGLYRLKGSTLQPVAFGDDKPRSFYHLSVGEGVLWSIGEFDVMSFDGVQWVRVPWQLP